MVPAGHGGRSRCRPGAGHDFIGVDIGIANIAADSDGTEHWGEPVEKIRRKHNLQRKRLQRKGTKGAKKKLKRIAGKEARFRKHENHCITKKIVVNAKGTGRGIAVEDLDGIRERVTARGTDARNRLSGWSFAQLYAFLAYKAQLAGVRDRDHRSPQHQPDVCPSVVIAGSPTARARPSLLARRVVTGPTPT